MTPVRRKWDGSHRTTRWRAAAKIGTQPYGTIFFDKRPVIGERRRVWTSQRHGEVIIERIVDGQVLCAWV